VDPGFRTDRVIAARLDPLATRYADPARTGALYGTLLERVASLPGVQAAGAASALPLRGQWGMMAFRLDGVPQDPGNLPMAFYQVVTPDYPRAMGIPLLAGADVGTSVANTNAVNRDGRLSSGFNLVDLIARLDLTRSRRFPVALIFDFVRNTQAHDVVTAGAGGANRLLPNHEDSGYWAEIQVGKSRAAGDVLFDYTFLRIEKDAVLTPFNFSDILQPSDVRAHRLSFTYTVEPRVLLTLTDIISQRPNGLLGAFGATPPGSLNRPTHRLQFDTVFRF
jgi:hypothetical protein